MSLLSILRNRGFWLLDATKGSVVREAYDEIKRFDGMDSESSAIREYQKEKWLELRERATQETVFYAPFKEKSFFEFPVINKNDIRSHQQSFFSSFYQKDKLYQMATSGSTGTPFISYQNSIKKKRVHAEAIYYSEKVGYRLGENLSYIRSLVQQVKKSKLKQFLQNQRLIQCGYLDDAGIENIISEIKRFSKYGNVTLMSYATTFTAIKDYCNRKGISSFPGLNVTGVVSGSEMLFDDTREAISRVFNRPTVVSRYANEENGIIGQDEGLNNVFPINEADYLVEILDGDGQPVAGGGLGRVVITDLYNYAMPMIRYDTGDIAGVETLELNGRKKRCLTNFSGRKLDIIYDTKGHALSPYMIVNNMWSFTDISQFQIIQRNKKQYILKLNAPATFQREKAILDLFAGILGQDAEIKVERVDEIPVLASGKRRYITNEWK